jgi:hypothetical protein
MIIKNRTIITYLLATIAMLSLSFCQNLNKTSDSKTTINQVVEASCGQCNFKLKTQKGCDLAVRIDGKAYFVDGSNIDDHGDAHANDGFCNDIRKAKVNGSIVDGRFKASEFKLIN